MSGALRPRMALAPRVQFAGLTGVEAMVESRMSRSLAKTPLIIKDFASRAKYTRKEREAMSRQRQLKALRERREG